MKPLSGDYRHKLLISGDELRELKKNIQHGGSLGLDRKIEKYQEPVRSRLTLGFGMSARRDRLRSPR